MNFFSFKICKNKYFARYVFVTRWNCKIVARNALQSIIQLIKNVNDFIKTKIRIFFIDTYDIIERMFVKIIAMIIRRIFSIVSLKK